MEGGGVQTSKLISMLRNEAEKIENVEVIERPKGKRQYEAFPLFGRVPRSNVSGHTSAPIFMSSSALKMGALG